MNPYLTEFGGGSGGDGAAPAQPCTKNTDEHRIDGTYSNIANQLELRAEPPQPPAPIDPCKILLFASNPLTHDGAVNLRGEAGVRISSGPAMLPPKPAIESTGILGLEVETCDLHSIKLTRGITPPNIQLITMTPTGGIAVDGAPLPVTVNSKTKIELDVVPGSITMTPASIQLSLGGSKISMTPEEIKIAVGANSITINAQGIAIQGLPAVNIN